MSRFTAPLTALAFVASATIASATGPAPEAEDTIIVVRPALLHVSTQAAAAVGGAGSAGVAGGAGAVAAGVGATAATVGGLSLAAVAGVAVAAGLVAAVAADSSSGSH